MVLLDTGIRVGELTRLTIGDINLETAELSVLPFRSGLKSRPRTIPLGAQTRKALWRYLSAREIKHKEASLFVSGNERQLSTNAVLHVIRDIGERAGVTKCHPHRFRHTFAIEYLRNGGDIFTLKRILGHSTLKTVEHYLSLVQSDVQTAHRKASPVDHWRL
jgi:integrase/recombinase XerD